MLLRHTYKHQAIDYHLIYKKRKTLGIYIDAYGNIEVRVPKVTSGEQIKGLLEDKWSWIIRKQSEQREKTKGFKEKNYQEEEALLYLGTHHPIHIDVDGSRASSTVELSEGSFKMHLDEYDEEVIKKLMTKFYKQQCKRLVESRIKLYQQNFKVKPRGFKIASNRKHWGTCNSLRELTFNWKLAMAPMEVIDYVVVHEMCHMVHMNHDRSFWRLVGKYIPDYEASQQWLKSSHWKMVV